MLALAPQVVALVVGLGSPDGGAPEPSVFVSATTLVGGRPDVVDGEVKSVTQISERVGLRVTHLPLKGFDDLAVVADAWGGLTLPDTPGGIGQSDVNLAYVEGRTFGRRLTLRLGRQLVTGGVARAMFFDGLFGDFRADFGLGISAFTGVPVARRFSNFTRGDFVVGTRVSYAHAYGSEVGVSLIHMLERGAVARQDLGLDARWKLWSVLSLSGAFVWSVADARLAELDVGPRVSLGDVEIEAGYRRTAPDLFLPRTSIFTVFADTSRDDLGASVAWQTTPRLSLLGEARALWINGEAGYEVGARVAFRPYRSARSSVTAQYHRLSVPSNGYQHGGIGARHTLPFGLGLSLDLETYALDRPVRGQTLSFSGSASVTYALAPSWQVSGTLFAATTPTFEHRYEGVVKLAYVFGSGAP